jgi:hypothetical protein
MTLHYLATATAGPRCLLGLALLATAVACADSGTPGADTTTAAGAEDASRPARRVVILTPAEGDTVGPEVHVTLGATGVTVEMADNSQEEGQGHHHLFLDTDVTAADAPIPPTTAQIIHLGTGAAEHHLAGLTPGPHRLIAVFAYGNHIPMAGTATDTVNFVVRR